MLCECVCMSVNTNTHTPLIHIQRLFYRNWCNKSAQLQTPPTPHPVRWLVWRDSISSLIGSRVCQSERVPLHMEGLKPRWHQLCFYSPLDKLEQKLQFTVNICGGENILRFLRWWNIYRIMIMMMFQAAG